MPQTPNEQVYSLVGQHILLWLVSQPYRGYWSPFLRNLKKEKYSSTFINVRSPADRDGKQSVFKIPQIARIIPGMFRPEY